MLLKILKYGDPKLETPCEPIKEFDTPELRKLVKDMFETMYAAEGVGLAAPQVGVLERLFIVDCSCGEDKKQKLVLINPEIIAAEGEQVGEEGCLSIPGFREPVKRAMTVTVKARNVKGEEIEISGDELLARAVLHENDHINGVLFLKHLSKLKRELIKRKIRNLRKKGEWD
jgi:peptide deformylase